MNVKQTTVTTSSARRKMVKNTTRPTRRRAVMIRNRTVKTRNLLEKTVKSYTPPDPRIPNRQPDRYSVLMNLCCLSRCVPTKEARAISNVHRTTPQPKRTQSPSPLYSQIGNTIRLSPRTHNVLPARYRRYHCTHRSLDIGGINHPTS